MEELVQVGGPVAVIAIFVVLIAKEAKPILLGIFGKAKSNGTLTGVKDAIEDMAEEQTRCHTVLVDKIVTKDDKVIEKMNEQTIVLTKICERQKITNDTLSRLEGRN